ncbi:MAG: Hpt domain-containing protein [Arcobacter sp.]|nr:Hpt domain-containing protein [Arcobacter sp.]
MYCILNQSNDLVASDLEFLKLFNTNSLVDLYRKISTGSAKISLDYDKITLTLNNNVNTYDIKVTPLTTLFGKSVLIELSTPLANEIIESSYFSTPSISEQESIVPSEEIQTKNIEPEEAPQPKIEIQKIAQESEAEDISTTDTKEEQKKSIEENKEYLIDTPIILNIPEIAQNMHLSDNDYRFFLNEYTSSVDKLKDDLESENNYTKANAIKFIQHITVALNLPKDIKNLVNSLKIDGSKELFQNFFDVIENIKEQNKLFLTPAAEIKAEVESNVSVAKEEIEIIPIDENIISLKEENKEQLPEIQIEPVIRETNPIEININEMGLETPDSLIALESKEENKSVFQADSNKYLKIDLSNIKPLPFDFIVDESAKELSLPIDIVKEFIKDFIEQCHEDTDKIIKRYEEHDIEKIKKLAHTLKGISSNLYMMPLADTLLKLQNNDDLTQVKPLVEKYWGQFLYLENLMKNI